MNADIIIPVVAGFCFVGAWLCERAARRQSDAALGHLRNATEAYRDARHEREEAHRVLRLACALSGLDPGETEEAEEAATSSDKAGGA